MPSPCSSEGVIMRRLDGGAGAAPADVPRKPSPGGLGSPSIPNRRDRLQWQDAAGRRRAKSRRINGAKALVRSNSHGPGDRNRRSGAPKGAASSRRQVYAICAGLIALRMPTQAPAGLAACKRGVICWCAVRRSAPSDIFPGVETSLGHLVRGNGTQAHPSPEQNTGR
jgi:hypothetical protein